MHRKGMKWQHQDKRDEKPRKRTGQITQMDLDLDKNICFSFLIYQRIL